MQSVRGGCPQRHFEENQLSPSLISLSLQSSARPSPFQRTRVRPSTPRYGGFNLAKGSSLGFGSTADDLGAHFGLAFAAAPPLGGLTSPPTVTRGLIMQKASSHPLRGSYSFVGTRFQVSFTPLAAVLFTFPSRYSFTIGHQRVFRLGGWAPRIRTGFHVSRPTWEFARPLLHFAYGAFTLCGRTFQTVRLCRNDAMRRSRNPTEQAPWFGLFRFRSPLLAESRLDFFSSGY